MRTRPRLGATPSGDGRGTRFAVWAPNADRVDVVLLDPDDTVSLEPRGDAREHAVAAGLERHPLVRVEQDDVDAIGVRRPHGEACPGPVRVRRRPQPGASGHAAPSWARIRHESGGSTSVIEWSRPCAGSATASTRPMLPAPLPP